MNEGPPGEAIGRNVREIRERQFLSRTDLSKRSGVSKAGIDHLERGLSGRPRRKTIEKIAAALEVDVETLLKGAVGDAPKAEAPPSQRSLFNGPEEERRRDQLAEVRESYRETAEGLSRYCDAWERRLANNDLDRESVRGFLEAADAILPALTDSVVSELMELASIVGTDAGYVSDEMRSEASVASAAHRYHDIGRRVEAAWRERFAADDSEADDPKVIDFRARRDEMWRRIA